MGDLIVMTRPTGVSRREIPCDASADILFFTGVRYHRMPEQISVEEAAVASPVRRRSEKAKKAAEARRIKRLA